MSEHPDPETALLHHPPVCDVTTRRQRLTCPGCGVTMQGPPPGYPRRYYSIPHFSDLHHSHTLVARAVYWVDPAHPEPARLWIPWQWT